MALHGIWQRRILQTLEEATVPLTYRQLRIRCGMWTPSTGRGAANVRMACGELVRRHLIVRVWPGLFILRKEAAIL